MQNNNCFHVVWTYLREINSALKQIKQRNEDRPKLQKKVGSFGVRGVLPEVAATLLKQHHQSSISCHSPKLRSEQIHVSGKGQILACALAQLDSLPLTLCQARVVLLHSFNTNDCVHEKFFHDLFSTPASPPHLSGTTTFHYTLWESPLWDRLI